MSKKKKLTGLLLSLTVAFVCAIFMMPQTVFGAQGDVPQHNKTLTNNGDGTYQLALSIRGDSEKIVNKVNVIVILDTSSSMNNGTGGGPGSGTRIAAAKNAVNSLARTLLNLNGQGDNPNDAVEMALVRFGTQASVVQQPTTSTNTFTSAVSNINIPTGQGTNWEDGLQTANEDINFGDNNQTFVIFVSDGNPTFRNTRGDYQNIDTYGNYPQTYGVYGTGSDNNATTVQRCYDHAVDDAAALAEKVGTTNFYTIGAYGDVSRMQSLTTAAGAPIGNYFSAASTSELESALESILEDIQTAGIGSVSINDPTTTDVVVSSEVTSHLLKVDTNSFKYYKNSTEWTDAPEATLDENGNVVWDLKSAGVLDNGVTYTVTFDVWPTQETYDIIADLENGDKVYDQLPSQIREYLIENDGKYTLKTNKDFPQVSYIDTREDNPQVHTIDYTNPLPVRTDVSEMDVAKVWFNDLDDRGKQEYPNGFDMDLTRDDEVCDQVTVKPDDWEDSVYISTGLMRVHHDEDGSITGIEVLEKGHDYTLVEPENMHYRWELVVETIHPMLVNGVLTSLVEVLPKDIPSGMGSADFYTLEGVNFYRIDDKVYKENGQGDHASVSAYNERKSNLNITKVVDGKDAPADEVFEYTISATDPNGDDLWFSVVTDPENPDESLVKDLDTTATAEEGNTGYYYFSSGGTVTVKMQAGWNLRFTNLPTGTTYTVEETTTGMSTGFTFDEVNGDTPIKVSELPDGAVALGDDTYTYNGIIYTGNATDGYIYTYQPTINGAKVEGEVVAPNGAYQVTYTNLYSLKDVEITKVWEDNDNQDGKRPTADEFKSYLTLKADGTDVTDANKDKLTVTENEDGTFTAKWTAVPRFKENTTTKEEITYTVEESEIEGYTTEGSPAADGGTITNTHTPETVDVKVVKEWNDSNNIGNIRPTSIQVQLKADDATSGDPETLNADNEWTYTWKDLPKYADGEEIVYTADETAVPAGYEKSGPEKSTAADGTITFTVTNTYNPTPVSVDPPVQKVIENNSELYNGGDFTFTIEAVSPEDAPMPEHTSITNSAQYELEGKTGFYEFGEITFTQPGTYTYKVTESGEVDGVTNDPDAETGKTLTFEVTDDGEGNLVVDPTTDEVELSFTNVYDASGEGEITVTKELVGAAWPAGKTLTFTLTGDDGAPMPTTTTATLSAEGDVTFGPIAYSLEDAGKTYTYTISEDGFGTDSGWSGSGDVTATVEVTDKGDGTLDTEVTYSPEDATITNTYDASGEGEITVTKELSGAEWPAGKTLTFTLTGDDGAPMPETTTATLSAAGAVTFGPIEYELKDAGKTYTYTVSEDGFGTDSGWSGSGDVTATVKVSDNGDGSLSADVTYSPNAVITNTYDATGSATLTANKILEGRDWKDGETFTFELQDETGEAIDSKEVSEDNETASFTVEYGLDDVGTHTYTIAETGTLPNGVTASADISATVVVSDNGDGTLDAAVTYEDGNTITNTYEPESVKAHIDVSKTIEGYAKNEDPQYLDGEKTSADNTFEFTLYDKDGKQVGDPITITTEDGEGAASFADIEYTKAGTYTYTVKETKGDAKGITYSEKEYPVTVTVTDNTDEGKLEAEISYGEAEEGEEAPTSVEVENQFKMTSVDVELELTKTIDDQSNSAPDSTFEFTLYKDSVSDENKVDEKSIKTKDLTGSVKFDPLTFDKCGEYTYVVVEKDSGENGFTYDPEEHTYKIIVKENFEVAVLKVDEEASTLEVEIVNVYKAAATEATLKVKKEIEDTSGSAYETEFTFELSDNDGKKIDEVTVVGPNEGEFAPITYEKAGTYHYTIKETAGSAAGYQYDSKAYDVTVEVVDNEGQLEATVTYSTASGTSQTEMTIVNTYDPQDAKITLKAKKVIEDKTGGAKGKTFTFELVNANGKVIDTVTRTGGGTVTFKELTYSKVGTYEYTIREVAGKDKGYTYDTSEYPVSVEVTDPDKDGVLKAEITTEGEIVITNTYEAEPCVLALTANKELTGRSLKDGEFTFQLLDEDGELVAESTNDASGKIKFDDITFDAAGTYTYTVAEVAGDEDGMTYDANEYTITIKVTDEGEGVLVAKAQGDVTFQNVFKEEPPEPVPDTGDNSSVGTAMGVMLASLIGLIGSAFIGRRRREEM